MGSALGKRVAPEDGQFSAMEEGRFPATEEEFKAVMCLRYGALNKEIWKLILEVKEGKVPEVPEGTGASEQVPEVQERTGASSEQVPELEKPSPLFGRAFVWEVTELLEYLAKKPPAALCRALEAPPPEPPSFRSKLRRVFEWAMEEEDRVLDKQWWDYRRLKAPDECLEQGWAKLQEESDKEKSCQREKFWKDCFPPDDEEEGPWGMAALMRDYVYEDIPLEELGLGSREVLKYLARGNHSREDDALLRALEELPPLAEPLAEAEAEAEAPHFRAGRVVAESPEEEERLWKEMKQGWARKEDERVRKLEEWKEKSEERRREREEWERKWEEREAEWKRRKEAKKAWWREREEEQRIREEKQRIQEAEWRGEVEGAEEVWERDLEETRI